jgi:carbon-monoxide dehydrogenase medium subunit
VKAFEYVAPTRISDALTILLGKDGTTHPLAGGTDLIVQLRHGDICVDRVVDVKRIPELGLITFDPHEGLTIGAAVSLHRIAEDRNLNMFYPGLVDAVSLIGSTAIRRRATMGGNLCNASPSGDSIPAMIAMEAQCNIAGPVGMRKVPVEFFCTGPGKTVLSREELLTSIQFPPPVVNSGSCYLRFTPRNEMDIAIVGVAASVKLSENLANISSGRIALGAVGPTPIFVEAAGKVLQDEAPSEEAFGQAVRKAREAALPITDVRGTEAQRRQLVGVLTRRALRKAVERAKGGTAGER